MDNDWIENLRNISRQAEEAAKPCNVLTGTVTGTSPVAVQIDQKITVTASQLLIPRYLTDHVEQMSILGVGDVAVTVKNALKGGEAVILVQKRGAQQYLVVDRY
ncbi:hypothetical protein ADH76_32685 [Enterocloster clostridioformis]|uniref:DUF2577 domain-containing protein n=1 Tax=Enterocloster clostridioformis TaxID=1531 RepID=UPI00080CAFB1|nr:DUF2577 domain-containing protein [Enterocloster clostridioformis]ANU49163.1 hypothetical protein A4V08_28385 [Lachnoclostridium sp. YL32]NDO27054.1 DUF2577 domain-containing protein [Enterocloster clostridioformis]OXE61880.1 hypothetical protein ADH76_32685 [Enterocloster clostridioformis]QQR01909.1 DUF2577 domain-containing protein [Enterocloster clostridioformis]